MNKVKISEKLDTKKKKPTFFGKRKVKQSDMKADLSSQWIFSFNCQIY